MFTNLLSRGDFTSFLLLSNRYGHSERVEIVLGLQLINCFVCPVMLQNSLDSDFWKQRSNVSQIETTSGKQIQPTERANFHCCLYEDIGYIAKTSLCSSQSFHFSSKQTWLFLSDHVFSSSYYWWYPVWIIYFGRRPTGIFLQMRNVFKPLVQLGILVRLHYVLLCMTLKHFHYYLEWQIN